MKKSMRIAAGLIAGLLALTPCVVTSLTAEATSITIKGAGTGDAEHEYTVASFGFGDGQAIREPIIFKRKLSQEGSTSKAERVSIREIEDYVTKLNS